MMMLLMVMMMGPFQCPTAILKSTTLENRAGVFSGPVELQVGMDVSYVSLSCPAKVTWSCLSFAFHALCSPTPF